MGVPARFYRLFAQCLAQWVITVILRQHLRAADFAAKALGHFEVFKPAKGQRLRSLIMDWSLTPTDWDSKPSDI
jgi:hypothetical protein